MPIPAGLLARLQKRGIAVKQEEKRPEKRQKVNEEVEEVFAEDYGNDEPLLPASAAAAGAKAAPEPAEEEPDAREMEGPLIHEVNGCPNITNPFHECNDWCRKNWGNKKFEPGVDMLRKKARMLRRYPLPEDWYEIADPTTQRCYYWNSITDEISWLSPTHPRAKITIAEDKMRDMVRATEVRIVVEDKPGREEKMAEDEEYEFEALESEIQKEKKQRQKLREKSKGKRKRDEELDPMDPASYSDIPRGNWSAGLEQRGAAKTGVDTTASGPLFQQRPYPSPGDILRANRKMDD
ncbi:polyglutamine-binding protein 1-like [Lineus longissimus]|uniref:polyglutamine-binding protein 1-like n=1 Tax=Lineus longissimus TaxID=88925 RepID=UPI002B4F298E